MSWSGRSLAPGEVHRGVCDEGRVRAACGLTFLPSRDSGQARYSELPEPERICPGCLARTDGRVVIPAMGSTYPNEAGEVISLVMRTLDHSQITLESHIPGECVLTVHAAVLFDLLGEWLG